MSRIQPPRPDVSKEIDWLFLRSLGPCDKEWEGGCPINLPELEGFIGARELLPRIWARTDREVLEDELDASGIESIERGFREAVVVELRDEEVCRQLGELAREQQIQLLFLKGMALRLAGFAAPGTRWAADIDVLVPEEESGEFFRGLIDLGALARDLPASDQHLPVVEHPSGALVEIHHRLRGVVLDKGQDVRLDELEDHGLCERLGPPLENALVPNRELQVAHLLVHALGQHGYWPSAYPQVQLLGDLQDLGFADEEDPSFIEAVRELSAAGVGFEEARTVSQLVLQLSTGERVSEIATRHDPLGLTLRHLLAGATDPAYRKALKVEGSLHFATGQFRSLSPFTTFRKALFLTDGQIDMIYGEPKSRWGYWGRRVWRPVDLVGRAARYSGDWLRVRRHVK